MDLGQVLFHPPKFPGYGISFEEMAYWEVGVDGVLGTGPAHTIAEKILIYGER